MQDLHEPNEHSIEEDGRKQSPSSPWDLIQTARTSVAGVDYHWFGVDAAGIRRKYLLKEIDKAVEALQELKERIENGKERL